MSLHNYDHLLGFDLSSDFHIIRDVNDDGNPTFGIGFEQSTNDDGEITYEYIINLVDGENKDVNKSDDDSSTYRLKSAIENAVSIKRTVRSFFGIELVITAFVITLQHKEKAYVLNSVYLREGESVLGWIKFINDVLSSVVLDGKKGDFSPITEDMIQQGSAAQNNSNTNAEMANFSVGDIATVEYSDNRYATANGAFKLPVPDGYHYSSGDGAGNENWFYIVPDNVPLDSNHIDARPFSFAITTLSVGKVPFDMQKVEGYGKALVQVGALSGDTWVDTLILSSNCAFFYQCWTDTSEYMYHKLNGLLLDGSNAYQFHVFANYDAPIAADTGALHKFLETALSWMGRVSRIGDPAYRLEDKDERREKVTGFIDSACDLVAKSTNLLGITMDFDTELRKHFVILGALLYRHHNIALTYTSAAQIANMVGKIEGHELDAAAIQNILNSSDARFGDIHDYLESFSVTSLIKQLVKLDKMVNTDSEEGTSHFYFEAVELYLRLLCLESGISFAKSDFYLGCRIGTRLIIGNVWDSINIQVFPGGSSVSDNFASPRESGFSSANTKRRSSNQSAVAETPGNKSASQLAHTTNPSPKNPALSPKLWEMDGTTLLKYHGNAWNPEVPEGITVIGERAFADRNNVKKIYMRNGVTRIEHLAFANIAPYELMIPPTVVYIADDIFGDRRYIGSNGERWPSITELKLVMVQGSYADLYFQRKSLPNIKIEYVSESRTARRKKKAPVAVASLKGESAISEVSKAYFDKFEKVNVPKTRRKLLDKSLAAQKTTGYDLIIRPIAVDESFRRVQKAAEEHYKIPDLYDQAAEYATLFPTATEVEIHSGYIKNIASVHALKSFVSTGYFYCKKQKKHFKNLSTEEIIALADYIDFCGGTNFKPHNYQSNAVFCEFLREEKESGYKVFNIFDPEFTSATATGLCIDLNTIQPQIEKIYNHLLSQDDPGMVNGALANILIAWCTFAIACSKNGAFTVDQATDDSELSQCDIPEYTPIKAAPIIKTEDGLFIVDGWLIDYKGASDCIVIPEMVVGILPARKNPDLLIDINPLGKATTIKFASPKTDLSKCSMQKRHVSAIEIAEGIEIIPEGFLSGNIDVKEVVLPESIKEIRSKAFHSYSWEYEHNKKTPMKVNVPFGVREIADDAFSECQRITVCKASYAERFFEERNFSNVQVTLTKEQLEVQKREEERRKQEYEERRRREAEERARKAAEEAEQRRKAAEEAERKRQAELVEKRSRYDALQKNISEQEQIIAENRGWFGAQAKARKAAKEQLASLQAQFNREFPKGRP